MYRVTALLLIILSISVKTQNFQWVDVSELNVQFNPTYLRASVTLDDSANPVYARLIKYKEIYSSTYYGKVEIKKTTPNALLIWADTLFGGVDVKQIITDVDNNIICLGSYTDTIRIGDSSLTRIGSGTSDFLLKLDQLGSVVWLKDGSHYISGFDEIHTLTNAGSNNFLLGLGSYSVVTKILTINSSGNIINNIEQLNTGTISDIEVDVYNNIWCTGFTFSGSVSFNGLDTIAPFDYNDYVVKYNPAGQAQWISFIKDFTVQEFKIESDDSGYIYLSGNLFDSTTFGNLHTHGPQWSYDYFITKINQDGNYLWINEIPLGNNQGDGTVGNGDYLACTKNGDTYISGFFRGQINFGNGIQVSNSGVSNYDILVLKYNSSGEIQSAKTAGGSLYDHGSSIAADDNENFYVTGLIQSNSVFDTINVFANDNSLFVSKAGFNNVVPVELVSFNYSINGSDVVLKWITSTELNNAGFHVEKQKSNDNKNEGWQSIGFVEGAGTSSEMNSYSFVDKISTEGKLYYRFKQIDFNGNFKYSPIIEIFNTPIEFNLAQNFPNPFNPATKIKYAIGSNQFVSLKVYDVLGNEVVTLVNEEKPSGNYEVEFDASRFSSGVYFYTLKSSDFSLSKKMILMK